MRRPPLGLELGRPPSHPARGCCSAAARPALADTSTRGEARADRVASTVYVSGVVATAIGVTADLSVARRGRSREVRRARARCLCACVRPHVRPLAPPGAAAAAASLPGPRALVVHDLTASFAAPSQAPAPSQRRRCAWIRPPGIAITSFERRPKQWSPNGVI